MAKSRAIAFALLCALFTTATAFFAYYTARLAWVNLTAPDISSHRQSGMYVGALAFPLATAVFGGFAIWCARAVSRARIGGSP
jgi:hypothetical protein